MENPIHLSSCTGMQGSPQEGGSFLDVLLLALKTELGRYKDQFDCTRIIATEYEKKAKLDGNALSARCG